MRGVRLLEWAPLDGLGRLPIRRPGNGCAASYRVLLPDMRRKRVRPQPPRLSRPSRKGIAREEGHGIECPSPRACAISREPQKSSAAYYARTSAVHSTAALNGGQKHSRSLRFDLNA